MSASETVWLATSLAHLDELPAKGPMLGLGLGVWLLTVALLWLNRLFSELPYGVRVLGGENRWLELFGVALSWLLYAAVVLLALGAAQAYMGFLQHVPSLADLAQALDAISLPTPDRRRPGAPPMVVRLLCSASPGGRSAALARLAPCPLASAPQRSNAA